MTPADLRAKAEKLITGVYLGAENGRRDLAAFVAALCSVVEAARNAQLLYMPDLKCTCAKCWTFRPVSEALSRLDELTK